MTIAKPKITWNSITTTLPVHLEAGSVWEAPAVEKVMVNTAFSGKKEMLVLGYSKGGKLIFNRILDADYISLFSMFSWIGSGQVFSFLSDGSKTAFNSPITSITGTTVKVTSTTGLTSGDTLYLRNGTWQEEYITVLSITNGTDFETTAAPKFTYASGDICRMRGYFPSLTIPNQGKVNIPSPQVGLLRYNVTIDFEEYI